jgi:hypothetical protein
VRIRATGRLPPGLEPWFGAQADRLADARGQQLRAMAAGNDVPSVDVGVGIAF